MSKKPLSTEERAQVLLRIQERGLARVHGAHIGWMKQADIKRCWTLNSCWVPRWAADAASYLYSSPLYESRKHFLAWAAMREGDAAPSCSVRDYVRAARAGHVLMAEDIF